MVAIVRGDVGIHLGKKAVQQFIQRIVIGGTKLADVDGTALIVDAGVKNACVLYARFAKGTVCQFFQPGPEFGARCV